MNSAAQQTFVESILTMFKTNDPVFNQKIVESGNVEKVRCFFQYVTTGDFDAVGKLLAVDVTAEIVGPRSFPICGKLSGREASIAGIRHNFSEIENQTSRLSGIIAQGDEVVVFGREQGRFVQTSHDYDLYFVQRFIFRDGLIAEFFELLAEV